MMAKSRSYQADLLKALQDPEEAQAYLNAALADENEEVFFLALQDVLEARKGTIRLGENPEYEQDNLDRSFSDRRILNLSNIRQILNSLGYRLSVEGISSQTESIF